jgi:sortase B
MKRFFVAILVVVFLTGCGGSKSAEVVSESATDSHVDFQELIKANDDIFAWIHIPETEIDYPVLQSQDGDDSFYTNHNANKQADERGAIFIEAANLKDMCDFNEVVHGSSPADGTMFAGLDKFLDRTYFEDHQYIYFYMDGNALVYCIMAAFIREDQRLLAQYDFSYAKGCQEFIDEIYNGKSMNKNIRKGWESGLSPEHFLVTLTTVSPQYPGKQIVVVGCLVGDVAGKIDREIDWSDPDSEW